MKFSPSQKELYKSNLKALKNPVLKDKLAKLKQCNYELIAKDSLNINLKDKRDKSLIYKDPLKELQSFIELYNDKYLFYPVLYFYGFGNGILYKVLLQNQNRELIVVFEKELSIIWLMFHILDFSEELKSGKLVIFDTHYIFPFDLITLFEHKPALLFLRVYFLELHSSYYHKFEDDVLKVNNNNMKYLRQVVLKPGNDPIDCLQGIEQFTFNLPKMLSHPSLKELISKRKGKSKNAIIVSTGPSLMKQLPLLKQYANKASIFCADSSYPILAKEGIKPDYVLSLERHWATSEFFDNDFGAFDEGILFIVASLTYPKTIEYFERNNRSYMLVTRDYAFSGSLRLDDFGYIHLANSVAHTAFDIACKLKYENIILIGQDLAYGEDGSSHPKEHLWGANDALDEEQMEEAKKEMTKTKAWGGKGEVMTKQGWNIMRETFEILISIAPPTYNATEGGARIEGTIEKPFKWCCENLLAKENDKSFEALENLSLAKQNELMLRSYAKIFQSIRNCRNFQKKGLEKLSHLQTIYDQFSTLNIDEQKEFSIFVLKEIDNIKTTLENDLRKTNDLIEVLIPTLSHFEQNLARIFVINPKSDEEWLDKNLSWIKDHVFYLKLLISQIEHQEKILLHNIKPLQECLKHRSCEKYMRRIENAK